MRELILLRHGKTVANEKNIYCGSVDLPLSSAGRKEIAKNKGIYPLCGAYFTSGMKRCDETLQIIAGEDTPFQPVPLLKEINLGRFELKSYEDLKADKEYMLWINDKTGSVRCPGGESKNMLYSRVSLGLLSLTERILKGDHELSMCVTHGGVIVAIMETVFGRGKGFYDWQPKPGYGYKLTHDGESGYTGYESLRLS